MVKEKGKQNGEISKSENKTESILEDPKINVRILLASFWISHFLLWTFGDMVALLQETTEPVSNNLLSFVAAPLAVLQTFMIVFSLIGEPKWVRGVNICIAPVFILFNIGYLSEGAHGWHYILGIAYILFNILIIWYAWNWPTCEEVKVK